MSDTFPHRVEEIYRLYGAPEEVSKVAVALKLRSQGSSDEDVIDKLLSKYKVDRTQHKRKRIETFYKVYAPDSMQKVDVAMRMETTEEALMGQLFGKYGVPYPPPAGEGPAAKLQKADSVPAPAAAAPPTESKKAEAPPAVEKTPAPAPAAPPAEAPKPPKPVSPPRKETPKRKPSPAKQEERAASPSIDEAPSPDRQFSRTRSNTSTSSAEYRALEVEVAAFLQERAPHQLHKIPSILAMRLPRDQLMRRLNDKYPPVASPGSPEKPRATPNVMASQAPVRPASEAPKDVAAPPPVQQRPPIQLDDDDPLPVQSQAPQQQVAAPPQAPQTVAPHVQVQPPQPMPQPQQLPVQTVTPLQPPTGHVPATHEPVASPANADELRSLREQVASLKTQLDREHNLQQNLHTREEELRAREQAVEAREVAVEAKNAATTALVKSYPGGNDTFTPSLFSAKIDTAAGKVPATHDTSRLHQHLVSVEARLFEKCLQLQAHEEICAVRERGILQKEVQLDRRETQIATKERAQAEHERVAATQTAAKQAAAKELAQNAEAAASRVEQQLREIDTKEKDLQRRERDVAGKLEELSVRTKALAAESELIEKERDVCKRLSQDVLKREATVRSVEKSLNIARAELRKLEDDVTLRAKKLIDDEEAIRRWSLEVDKKEGAVNAMMVQVRSVKPE